MKNSINNKEKNVSCIHPGCGFAETGRSDYDDFDNPLKAIDIIPQGTEIRLIETKNVQNGLDGPYLEITRQLPPEVARPSDVRRESLVTVIVPAGEHPIDFLKEIGVDITKAWVFMEEKVVKTLKEFPCKFHQKTVAYGEFFRFENFDTISLQTVEYFDSWRVLFNWEFDGKKFGRTEEPEVIIEVVME